MFCLFSQRKLSLMAAVALFCCMVPSAVVARALPENPKEISWHISAAMVTYDNERQLYIAEDDVVITGGATRLEADYVEFSNKTKDAFAQGNVLLLSGQDSITCNAMQINLLTEKGTINKGTIFIQENHFYISGENIKKTGEFTYNADKGSITSCNGETPDWKITGKNIKVTIEGYGSANHAVLWAKKIPGIYSPYISFPVKRKRQTGLLTPRLTSSDRKGFEYEQPLFIAISKNMDASLYADYMSDRGIKLAGEFRYVINETSQGAMLLDYLEDTKSDDGTKDTQNYSYASTLQRTDTERYWFRMKHDQDLTNGFMSRLDLDIASDEDYLLEFRDGFTGFDATNLYFEETFGRSLDEYDDTTRTNSLTISKYWSNYSFNAQTLWYDNITARQGNTADTTLQTLPSFEFDGARQQIGASDFYYTLDSEFRSFYRQDTTAALVNGQRADVYPKVYLPMRIAKAFFFEPYIGTRATAWHTDNFTDVNGIDDNFRTRATYDMGAQLSTSLNRVFTLNNDFADKIRHTLVPMIEYTFQPNVIQNDLPYFDELDTLAEKNLVTWSLTNSFVSRNLVDNPDGTKSNQYKEFVWTKLYQSYDLSVARDDLSKPWSNITLESEFNPFQYFTLDADIDWSPYNAHFERMNLGATLYDKRGDSINTAYRYTIASLETWYTRFSVTLTDQMVAYYSFERDLKTNNNIEDRVGITFNKDCWGMGLEYKEASADKSIAFLITLRGIGEFGYK
ncbi:MAG: LPS assembly protein LptD [Proteobacteria bacterium]|nr:LPS-assembly protein LptD [Desulfobacula sp.]MBU3952653.1 LPS assembly protein LptD [Pseudomonadota bacterium]MBU4130036.1 LPS assembly protein LptD [Pseudomonadota bacterium]